MDKRNILSIIGAVLSLILSVPAYVLVSETVSQFTQIKSATINFILLTIIASFIAYLSLRAITSQDFKKKLFNQLIKLNYFSIVGLMLVAIGIAISSTIFIPNLDIMLFLALFIALVIGFPLLILGAIISIIILTKKTDDSLTRGIAISTIVIVGLFILVAIIALFVPVASRTYYEIKGPKELSMNAQNCSEEFLKKYQEAVDIGNYTFCIEGFRQYNLTACGAIDKHSRYCKEVCRNNGELLFGDEDCWTVMKDAFKDQESVPYCDAQLNCNKKMHCYLILGKITSEDYDKRLTSDWESNNCNN